MDKIGHLEKLKVLVQRHEKTLMERAAQYKKKCDEENRKLNLLKSCLDDYRSNLKTNTQPIQSFKYQQYQAFFNQLEKAIHQQIEVFERVQKIHHKMLAEIELIKKKVKNMDKLISKEKTALQFLLDKRENQTATDLFNQMKYRK